MNKKNSPKKKTIPPDESIRKLEVTTKLLPCKLTEPELLVYGQDLAKIIQDMVAEEDRQSSMKAELKARLAGLESKHTELASKISRKEEFRDVEVESFLDFTANKYRETRKDTGEVIAERDIRESERQEALIK